MSAAPHEPRLARIAALVAEPARARMLCYLLAGEYASAGELARAGSVTAATASGHLSQLLEAGLVACEPRGRHRYFRLADGDVAHALEALAMVAERRSHRRAWSSPERQRLRHARTCYGHLAGALGVGLLERMLDAGWLVSGDGGFTLTAAGAHELDGWGIDGAAWLAKSRGVGVEAGVKAVVKAAAERRGPRFAYRCLDWSERRDHLAGEFAGALLAHFVSRDWLRRRSGERALDLTPAGREALRPLLGQAGLEVAEAES